MNKIRSYFVTFFEYNSKSALYKQILAHFQLKTKSLNKFI